MKLFVPTVFALVAADEKKVPPRHPLQRLNALNQFTEEMLNTWFTFLPSKDNWIQKFQNNAARMERAFTRGEQRCGHYDHNSEHGGPPERKRREDEEGNAPWDRYNREDPSVGAKQLTTGYRKWAERYISQCSGQRLYSHQVNRMNRWNGLLQGHLSDNQ